MLKKITKKQRIIMDLVLKEPKTYAELAKRLDISRYSIFDRVKRLREKGYLEPQGKIKPTLEGIDSIIERELM